VRFTDHEIRRYARQMVLPEVGGVGQERLRAAQVSAQSALEARLLSAAGVGAVTLAPGGDDDVEAAALRALATLKGLLAL